MTEKNFIRYSKLIAKSNNCKNKLPDIILITDISKLKNPINIISKIPRKSIIIIRDYNIKNRKKYIKKILQKAKYYKHFTLIANDPVLAKETKADGIHLPEYSIHRAAKYRKFFPSKIITASCHSLKSANKAYINKVNAILFSPIFPTSSHPKIKKFNLNNIRKIIKKINIPVYALGGVNNKTVKTLIKYKISKIAAIEAFKTIIKN